MAAVVTMFAYFPSGRLAGHRWRWLPVVLWVTTAVGAAGAAADMWRWRGPRLVARDQTFARHTVSGDLIAVLWPVVLFCTVAALGSIVVRYCRAAGVERQQLKWLMLAAIVSGSMLLLGEVVHSPHSLAVAISVVNSPVWIVLASGLAVLRYRLYDIDRIVSRTVSYIAVTGVVVSVYVGAVALIETGLGFSSSIAVAASTLAAAALVQPVRRRVQRAVDRRFDRAAYDARRTAEAFAQRLRDEVDVDTISSDLVATVECAVAPASLTLWVATT
jgi:hypothetical protein